MTSVYDSFFRNVLYCIVISTNHKTCSYLQEWISLGATGARALGPRAPEGPAKI